jgi:hypothetical protein
VVARRARLTTIFSALAERLAALDWHFPGPGLLPIVTALRNMDGAAASMGDAPSC